MRASTGWAVAVAGALTGLVVAPGGPVARVVAQDHGQTGGPGALFSAQCASCHVTPDPRVATDQAYIRQLQETA